MIDPRAVIDTTTLREIATAIWELGLSSPHKADTFLQKLEPELNALKKILRPHSVQGTDDAHDLAARFALAAMFAVHNHHIAAAVQMIADHRRAERVSSLSHLHVDPSWRCSCGAPIKAFDFHIEPDEIVHECRRCHARLIEIDLAPARAEKPAYEAAANDGAAE
jgi:hypothetical protein